MSTDRPAPVRLLDVDLFAPPDLTGTDDVEEASRILVRVHDVPIAFVRLPIPPGGLSGADLRSRLEAAVGPELADHLAQDAAGDRTAGNGRPFCQAEAIRLTESGPPVTVVIPTKDRPDQVAACVDSVRATGYRHLQILVVDNGSSSDATTRRIKERFGDRSDVRCLSMARPGTSRARNRGLAEASTEIVLFSDDDVSVDPLWIVAAVSGFEGNPDVAAVTGPILPTELATPAQVWIEEFGGFNKGFRRQVFELDHPPDRAVLFPYAAGSFGSGANMAFRRQALLSGGGFDVALGGGTPARGGEDLAAFVEVILRGGSLAYEPAMLVRHHHHRSYQRLKSVVLGYGIGLGAYLTKIAVDHPERLPGIVGRLPAGFRFLLDEGSPKNVGKSTTYPRRLSSLERIGLALGPLAYARGRWQMRSEAGPARVGDTSKSTTEAG